MLSIESAPRRILPQSAMQHGIGLSPTELSAPREIHKNYVFVDEHNRHKRLKVMRACEGCRRRKIKCDAATTNTWPCSACTRLKLHCIPPMLQYDRDYTSSAAPVVLDHDHTAEFDNSSGSGEEEFLHHQELLRGASRATVPDYQRENNTYRLSPHEQHTQTHSPPHTIPYSGLSSAENVESPLSAVQFQAPVYHTPTPIMRTQDQWQPDNDYASALVGSLKIDDSGVADYISAQGRRLARAPAYESWNEDEPNNPSFMPRQHEFAVRIPKEDMPRRDEAAEMFSIFFNHIHPYIPIINKATFYKLWNTSRDQISPLLLETIFACAGRLTTDPSKGLKWIAMASQHLDCFLDVPRLSTVQALLLLVKARESAPQRGYFFRSWMSMVQIIAMARDLGLEKHYDLHKQGVPCQEGSLECMTRVRVWQACFVYELMISAPQGREVMQCDPTTVDLSTPLRGTSELDDQEVMIHRNFIHFVRLIYNIRRMSDVHAKLKANPSWRNDPQFLESGSLEQWSYDLPPDLHIVVSTDLSQPPPQFESHYAGNLQVYFHLAKIMLHRPALAFGKTFASGGEWRHHMQVCTDSAKVICRMEEIIFEQYGMLGLQCMSRGVNFSIYALLTGAMIHLVAATCPDPEFNHDAKEYFTRTMRLMENCIDNSASSEMKGQIETFRQAFSADITRPFVLNPSFPFYHGDPPPSLDPRTYTQPENVGSTMASNGQINYTLPLSPPHSTGEAETKGESPAAVQSLVMLAAGQGAQPSTQPPMVENVTWNPSRLFDNWNTAFSVSSHHHSPQDGLGVNTLGGARNSSPNSYVPATIGIIDSFVSPGMWQDSVAAAVYSDSIGKRNFPFDNEDNGWNTPLPPHRGPVTRTPTSATASS